MTHRPLTIIESPFAPKEGLYTIGETMDYLVEILKHSWSLGELPFASHAYFPFFLSEINPQERQMGIEAGYQFWNFSDLSVQSMDEVQTPKIVFYTDLGMSPGMTKALERAKSLGTIHEFRNIR